MFLSGVSGLASVRAALIMARCGQYRPRPMVESMPGTLTVRRLVVGLVLVMAAPAAMPLSLDDVSTMARLGATGTAIRFIDAHQQDMDPADPAWQQLEQQRLEIHRRHEDWSGLVDRVRVLPDEVPDEFRLWALTLKAGALLDSGQPQAARAVLRGLLWTSSAADEAVFREYRRMVIRSYLLEGRHGDADIAIQRYRQDHGGDAPELRRLQARVLLHEARPDDALELLADLDDSEALMLRLFALVAAGEMDAGGARVRASSLAGRDDMDARMRRGLWLTVVRAARKDEDLVVEIGAWERALAGAPLELEPDPLFALQGKPWSPYLALGLALGNREGLMVGEDAAWFELAEALASEQATQARALLAVVAWRSPEAGAAREAHEDFARSLLAGAADIWVLDSLYRDLHLPVGAKRPEHVGHYLADVLVDAGEVAAASRWLRDLEAPPQDSEALSWEVRRARVLVLAGDAAAGARVLGRTLEERHDIPGAALDRMMQVIFDIQALRHHEEALALLDAVLATGVDSRRRREIMFWKGESYTALERHQEAGMHFMRSAVLDGQEGASQWGQAARYHAARALAEAGELEDAARLYRVMLRQTDDRARRSMLEHELQRVQARLYEQRRDTR